MKKNMYSLILSESVVREIDRLADETGTSRSALIDSVLARYCSVQTHEMMSESVFAAVFGLLSGTRFTPEREPGSGVMSIRTSLGFKYHPTVRYDVKLTPPPGSLGELRVGLRTQNRALMRVLGDFFEFLAHAEEEYNAEEREYSFDGTRFTRELKAPNGTDAATIAECINNYILAIDEMLNAFFAGSYSSKEEFDAEYLERTMSLPFPI